jgi:2-polyprenyl-3-methyl-5-hydroxy-6-metoxy-1,4-benzoquinol methylase
MNSWNDESGDWQDLALPTQAPRYKQIANFIDGFCPNGSVLDVGCGEAVLRDYLAEGVKYLGIEPSVKAVESARAKYGCDSIVHSTGEGFDPGHCRWDCVVFNEMLYYSLDPLGLLDKYAKLVKSVGIIIVSIYQKPESFSIKTRLRHWLHLRRQISNVHCTKMVHDYMVRDGWLIEREDTIVIPGAGEHWRIWLARPRPAKSANVADHLLRDPVHGSICGKRDSLGTGAR